MYNYGQEDYDITWDDLRVAFDGDEFAHIYEHVSRDELVEIYEQIPQDDIDQIDF